MDYTEVWNISKQTIDNSFYMAPLLVGSLFVVIETIALLFRKYRGKESLVFTFLNFISHPKYPASKAFIPIGIVLVFASGVIFLFSEMKLDEANHFLESDMLTTIEGTIDIEFEQPVTGHTGGDLVSIDDYTFEINYFIDSWFYHQSIAQGGLLTQGKNVRIQFIPTTEADEWMFGDGKILVIEERN